MDARQTKSRRKIEAALADLLQDRSLEALTIDEITAAAGVSRPTFYRNYADRESALDEAVTAWIARFQDRLTQVCGAGRYRGQTMIEVYITLLSDSLGPDERLVLLALSGHAGPRTRQKFDTTTRKLAQRALSDALPNAVEAADLALVTTFFSAAITQTVQARAAGEVSVDPDTAAAKIAGLVYSGLSAYSD